MTRVFSDFGDDLAYNLVTLRKPAGIVLSLLFLAISVLKSRLQAQQHPGAARVNLLAENKSSSAAQNADRALALVPANAAAAASKREITSGTVAKRSLRNLRGKCYA
jgi:hypothetical protein